MISTGPTNRPLGPLARWAQFAVRNPWGVIAVWVILIAVLGVARNRPGGEYVNQFEVPGSDSQAAVDLLNDRFPDAAGDTVSLVFQAPVGIIDPAARSEIDAALAQAAQLPGVTGVTSPFDVPEQVSDDGTVAYATLQYATAAIDVPTRMPSRCSPWSMPPRGHGTSQSRWTGSSRASASRDRPSPIRFRTAPRTFQAGRRPNVIQRCRARVDATTTDPFDRNAPETRRQASIKRLGDLFDSVECTALICLEERTTRCDMTIHRMSVLKYLSEKGEGTRPRIGQKIGAPPSSMTGIAVRLVEAGYVERGPSKIVRRSVVLRISTLGDEAPVQVMNQSWTLT